MKLEKLACDTNGHIASGSGDLTGIGEQNVIGCPDLIPAGSTLIFEVELLAIE